MNIYITYIRQRSYNFFQQHGLVLLLLFLAAVLFVPQAAFSSYAMSGGDVNAHILKMNALKPYFDRGYSPFWMPHVFSGMPTLVSIGWIGSFIGMPFFNKIEGCFGILNSHINYFFMSSVFFYVLGLALRMKPLVSMVGALAYAYSVYMAIILAAGHITKVIALVYLPGMVASVIFLLEGCMLEGFILMLLCAYRSSSHQQIFYYQFLVLLSVGIYYLVCFVKSKNYKIAFRRYIALIAIGVISALPSLIPSLLLLDHSKQTIRGGTLDLSDNTGPSSIKKAGLDIDYAFSWSYGKVETASVLYPGIYGYGRRGADFGEDSHIAQVMQSRFNYAERDAVNFSSQFTEHSYWGDMPFTEGPVYFGVLVFLLALFGAIYSKNKHLYWIIPLTVISIFMAWGRHFMAFNELLFNYLPLYDKFRTPSMILVIPQLTFAIMMMFGLTFIIDNKKLFAWRKRYFFRVTSIMGISVLVGLLLYLSLPYTNMRTGWKSTLVQSLKASPNMITALQQSGAPSSSDERLYVQLMQNTRSNIDATNYINNALQEDRSALFFRNIVYTVFIFLVFLSLLLLYARDKLTFKWFLLLAGVLVYTDLVSLDRCFVNKEIFDPPAPSKSANKVVVAKTPADIEILKDKDPNYRVFSTVYENPFQENNTSYYHKSIGGYSAAKSSIYDDLITYQLVKQNKQVLNMLNTKYFIEKDPSSGRPKAIKNPDALGNCWIAQHIRFVPDAKQEMRSLDTFNSRTTAIMQEKYKLMMKEPLVAYDPRARVHQTFFSADTIKYGYESPVTQVVIFSEIFNPYWNAYIDGEKVDILRANYVLRALQVPSGRHEIEFRCEPYSYKVYAGLMTFFNYLYLAGVLIVVLLIGIRIRTNVYASTN